MKALTLQQNKIINKRLNFIPTQPLDHFKFLTDFYKFCRTMRLKIFSQGTERAANKEKEKNPNLSKLKKKSTFDPVVSNNALDVFEQTVTNKVLKQWDQITAKKLKYS